MATRRRTYLGCLARIGVGAALVAAACTAAPSELGYRVPTPSSAVYAYGDTTVVGVSLMGQRLEIGMRGEADYGVSFAPSDPGVRVTLTVERLAGSLTLPMTEARRIDASQVDGALVFTLDPEGDATLVSAPDVSLEASRMISGLTTAHTFFPGLPARAVEVGDSWVDSVSYAGDAEAGGVTEHAVYEYTVVGDTAVGGRTLTNISLAGTSTIGTSLSVSGMRVVQSSTVELTGHVLWDLEAATLFEMVRRGVGSGTARVPLSPQPLPMSVEVTQRVRLLER